VESIMQALIQYKIIRALIGGNFVKLNNRWFGADVMGIREDGTRIMRLQTDGDHRTMMFFENSVEVQGIESFA
jgi:hypothetical protein